MGRWGRRPGAGRKRNNLRRIVIRSGDLARLSPEEIQFLSAIARKLRALAPDTPQNQTKSNTAAEAVEAVSEAIDVALEQRRTTLQLVTSQNVSDSVPYA